MGSVCINTAWYGQSHRRLCTDVQLFTPFIRMLGAIPLYSHMTSVLEMIKVIKSQVCCNVSDYSVYWRKLLVGITFDRRRSDQTP